MIKMTGKSNSNLKNIYFYYYVKVKLYRTRYMHERFKVISDLCLKLI